MKLLGTTRELNILTDTCHIDEKNYRENSGIKYPLYEANYISGMRMIFQKAIKVENYKKDKEGNIVEEEVSNILSFIGGRGAGKTTAMMEFCTILSEMDYKRRSNWWMENTLNEEERAILLNKDFYFHVLKPIDTSLLNDSDDLFELILANLYREFESEMQHKIYGYKDTIVVHNVLDDFSEIAKLYQNVIAHNRDEDGTSFISKLQIMKGSQQIKEKIAQLVENLCSLKKNADYEYVVIAIDDLDLNLKHGYEMLEQLQKYFSCHKIIVLVTLEYEQMELVCEEYFWKTMPRTSQLYLDAQKNRTLANDCLTKVFPLSQRMYMPEMQRISKKSKIKLLDEVFEGGEVKEEEKTIEVKRFILLKIAEIMGIYYDACGLKMHFIEPETVRNLVSYNKLLESLEEIDYKKLKTYQRVKNLGKTEHDYNKEVLRKYDKNHERFNADITIRMAQTLLNYEQKKAFDTLTKRDLERRAKYFISAKRIENKIIFGRINNNYAYGDLLEKIHNWGDENAQGDYFFDKPFIRCILASFTSEMVCQYIKYKYYPEDDKERKKYKKRLLDFLGKSFHSRWIAQSFVQVQPIANTVSNTNETDEDIKLPYFLYRQGDIPQRQINFEISLDILEDKKRQKIDINKSDIEQWLKEWFENTPLIWILEYVDMFFVRRDENAFKGITYKFKKATPLTDRYSKFKIEDNIDTSKAETEKRYVLNVWGNDVNNVTLDIMGFVAKSIDYEDVVTSLHANIAVELKSFFCQYFEIRRYAEKEELEQVIERETKKGIYKKSIFQEYIQNPEQEEQIPKKFEEDVAFPYYNLDMSYNIFKRVREHYKDKKIAEENIFKELYDFYKETLSSLLKKEATEYRNSDNFKYDKIYESCPYIKNIKKWEEEANEIIPILKQVFHNIHFEIPEAKN